MKTAFRVKAKSRAGQSKQMPLKFINGSNHARYGFPPSSVTEMAALIGFKNIYEQHPLPDDFSKSIFWRTLLKRSDTGSNP
ncbi:MAG: hypothetical protein V4662_20615 [Verrucomicrobiota bacterium]